uniref:BURP domain-containing protein n=1 Tax=Ananas comosus var. bracteatus TaxID=296719 RepID=A0A6V7PTB5_ANACO|nr:unnamed protein product [Ananas comosus var. bracteatus]
MDRFLPLLCFLLTAAVVSHAALPVQVYWQSALPNTPMPSAISDLLTPATDTLLDKKTGTSVTVGKGGVNVNTGNGKPGGGCGTTVGVGKGGVNVNTGNGKLGGGGGTTVGVGKGGVDVNTGNGKPGGGGGTTVGVGKGGVNVNTGNGKPGGGGGTTVGVGKGGVNVNTGNGKPGGGGGTTVGVGKGGVNVNTGKGKPGGSGTTVGVGKGGVNVNTGKGKPGGTNVHVNPGGVGVNVNPKNGKPPVVVHVHPGKNPFLYTYAATDTQLHDDRDVALFFLEKDLRPGATFTLHFTKTARTHFSIDQNSVEAEEMKNTLHECEEPAMNGEKKTCATSLESMVDFATSSLGTRRVRAISTTVHGEPQARKQRYAITGSGVRRANIGDEVVACHAEAYAYAVFYCHAAGSTRAYEVSMVGEEDGARAEAVAVCHTDTAAWNPKHLAFQVLKVAPGSVPVCHFLPQDSVVWTRSG